jgi:hypothetical protein
MRKRKLRRWLVRGVLFSAAVAGPFVAAGSASAEWTWNGVPSSGTNVTHVDTTNPANVNEPQTNEWTWN